MGENPPIHLEIFLCLDCLQNTFSTYLEVKIKKKCTQFLLASIGVSVTVCVKEAVYSCVLQKLRVHCDSVCSSVKFAILVKNTWICMNCLTSLPHAVKFFCSAQF
jgi:hypothetical protein